MSALIKDRPRHAPAKKAIMLDDEVNFLAKLKRAEDEGTIEFLTTTDPIECLQWVEQGRADTLVSDLVLENHPDWNGLDVLERARKARPEAQLKLWTGREVSDAQRLHARSIGAEIHFKSDGMEEVFEDIRSFTTAPRVDYFSLQMPLPGISSESKDRLYRLLVGDLIDELGRIPEPETKRIIRGGASFTVAELIRELEAGEGEHVEKYIDLWVKAKKQLRDMGRNP